MPVASKDWAKGAVNEPHPVVKVPVVALLLVEPSLHTAATYQE